MKSVITRGLVLAILGLSLGGMAPAWAGTMLFDFQDTTSNTNGGSQLIVGIYERNSTGNEAIPFTAQIYSSGNECVRLDMVDRGGADLKMVLVSPTGRVWRDDNAAGNLRPLVKAQTDVNGWYTLHVSEANGGGPATIFQLRYGRYSDPNNPNCIPGATPPL